MGVNIRENLIKIERVIELGLHLFCRYKDPSIIIENTYNLQTVVELIDKCDEYKNLLDEEIEALNWIKSNNFKDEVNMAISMINNYIEDSTKDGYKDMLYVEDNMIKLIGGQLRKKGIMKIEKK